MAIVPDSRTSWCPPNKGYHICPWRVPEIISRFIILISHVVSVFVWQMDICVWACRPVPHLHMINIDSSAKSDLGSSVVFLTPSASLPTFISSVLCGHIIMVRYLVQTFSFPFGILRGVGLFSQRSGVFHYMRACSLSCSLRWISYGESILGRPWCVGSRHYCPWTHCAHR